MTAATTATHRVAKGYQVNVNGTVFEQGQSLPPLAADVLGQWLSAGWIVPVEPDDPKGS